MLLPCYKLVAIRFCSNNTILSHEKGGLKSDVQHQYQVVQHQFPCHRHLRRRKIILKQDGSVRTYKQTEPESSRERWKMHSEPESSGASFEFPLFTSENPEAVCGATRYFKQPEFHLFHACGFKALRSRLQVGLKHPKTLFLEFVGPSP